MGRGQVKLDKSSHPKVEPTSTVSQELSKQLSLHLVQPSRCKTQVLSQTLECKIIYMAHLKINSPERLKNWEEKIETAPQNVQKAFCQAQPKPAGHSPAKLR